MKHFFPDSISSFILVVVSAFSFTGLIVFMMKSSLDIKTAPTIVFILFSAFALAIVWVTNRYRHISILKYYSASNYSGLLLATLIVILFNALINKPLAQMLPQFMQNGVQLQNTSLLDIFSTVIIGPLFEELLFRGSLLRGFLERYSWKKAILISSVIFALLHIEPAQILSAFCLGTIFGLIFYKTRNLIYVIVLHSVANGSLLLLKYYNPLFELSGFSLLLIVGTGIALLLVLVKKLCHALN